MVIAYVVSVNVYDLGELLIGNLGSMLAVQLSPFDVHLAQTVRKLQDEVRGLVPSSIIAEKMNLKPRTIRHYLRRVESAGLIFRPVGQRRGYSAMQDAICSLAVRDSIERQATLLDMLDVRLLRRLDTNESPMIASSIEIDVSDRTLRRRLQRMESLGLVHRPGGVRSGYAIRHVRSMRVCAAAEAMLIRRKVQPFHLYVLREMRWRERHCDTVLSRLLAEYLEVPDRTMRYHLNLMEGLNLVQRPHGSKAGYRLTQVAISLLELEGANDGTLN